MFTRLFGNCTENCVPGGDIVTNGCGKFNKITPKALNAMSKYDKTNRVNLCKVRKML